MIVLLERNLFYDTSARSRREALDITSQNSVGEAATTSIEERLGLDSVLFSLETVSAATCNFSLLNKLGEGGFGPVYKVLNYLFPSYYVILVG